jgi:hypothetical protein
VFGVVKQAPELFDLLAVHGRKVRMHRDVRRGSVLACWLRAAPPPPRRRHRRPCGPPPRSFDPPAAIHCTVGPGA